jgi:hypothetical protein
MRSEVIGDPKIKNHWPSGQPKVEIRKDGPQRRLCAHFVLRSLWVAAHHRL